MIQMRSAEARKVRIASFQATTMGSRHLVWKWFATKTPPLLEVLTLETHQCVDIESNRKCKKCMFKKGWSTGRVDHRCQL